MNFLEKLDLLMQREHINKHALSRLSGIPYTTIDGFYKKGYQNAKLSTLNRLCAYFSVSLDYLVKDAPQGEKADQSALSPEEVEMLCGYSQLTQQGKEYVRLTIQMAIKHPALGKAKE